MDPWRPFGFFDGVTLQMGSDARLVFVDLVTFRIFMAYNIFMNNESKSLLRTYLILEGRTSQQTKNIAKISKP